MLLNSASVAARKRAPFRQTCEHPGIQLFARSRLLISFHILCSTQSPQVLAALLIACASHSSRRASSIVLRCCMVPWVHHRSRMTNRGEPPSTIMLRDSVNRRAYSSAGNIGLSTSRQGCKIRQEACSILFLSSPSAHKRLYSNMIVSTTLASDFPQTNMFRFKKVLYFSNFTVFVVQCST